MTAPRTSRSARSPCVESCKFVKTTHTIRTPNNAPPGAGTGHTESRGMARIVAARVRADMAGLIAVAALASFSSAGGEKRACV